METRGRGREVRSTVDETPAFNTRRTVRAPTADPPSTRSRTRLHTRSTRASVSAGPLQGASIQNVGSHRISGGRSVTGLQPYSSPTTPRQRQASSGSGILPPQLHRQPNRFRGGSIGSRKRTRSVARGQAGYALASSHHSSPPHPLARSSSTSTALSGAAASAVFPTRPSKRPRRSTHGSRYTRVPPHQARAGRSSTISRSAGQAVDGMDQDNELTGMRGDPTESLRNDERPTPMGRDGAGSSSLQGLLRRLGADLNDIFPGNAGASHSRLQQWRTIISSPVSDEQQIDALSELCEFLSIGTEESLVSFSVNLFVSPLVNLLRTGTNVETKIYAARALTHMMEALPASSSSIANLGAAIPLCQNLLSIEYIDLAEQSLSALHKLSVNYPQQIVNANGFQAVLSFIDFFSVGVQRIAAATACNLCRLPRADAMDMIIEVLPLMMSLLDSEDQRIRESAIFGFRRLAESFRNAPARLEILCGDDEVLIEKVIGLIVPSLPSSLTPQSYSSALRLLAVLSHGNPALAMKVFGKKALIRLLNTKLSTGSALYSTDCLVLADSLLPDILELEAGAPSSGRSRRRRDTGSKQRLSATDMQQRDHLAMNSQVLQFFGETLFATLMKSYVSSADSTCRRLALLTMFKYVMAAPATVLKTILLEQGPVDSQLLLSQSNSVIGFAPFVADMLGDSCLDETLVGLAMANSALLKVSPLRESFVREGVVHAIMRLTVFDVDVQESTAGGVVPAARGQGLPVELSTAEESSGRSDAMSHDHAYPVSNVRSMDLIRRAVTTFQRGTLRHEFDTGPFSASPHTPAPMLDMRASASGVPNLREIIPEAARSILRSHLGAEGNGPTDETILQNTRLGVLTRICITLKAVNSSRDEAKGVEALSDLVQLLAGSERLTVFEISRSGIMAALALYLQPADAKRKLSRLSSLAQCLGIDGALSSLVRLAMGVLSAEEKLTVSTNEASSGIASSVSSGLRQLAQPLKLRLRKDCADRASRNLRDYSHHVVLIEPLATMTSVQEFLWPRVRESHRGSDVSLAVTPRRRSMHPRDPQAGRNAVVAHRSEEMSSLAPEDRINNQDSRDVEFDRFGSGDTLDAEEDVRDRFAKVEQQGEDRNSVDNSVDSDAEISSGDEDIIALEDGEGSDHEQDGANSFDADRLEASLPPFELDHNTLGPAPSRQEHFLNGSSGRPNIRMGPQTSSESGTSFRSYAAALATSGSGPVDDLIIPGSDRSRTGTGHASGEVDKVHAAKAARLQTLVFALKGASIPPDCSILSAVIHSFPHTHGPCLHLWSDVHTLVYSKAGVHPGMGTVIPERRKGVSSSVHPKGPRRVATDGIGSVRRSQRLLQNREKSQTVVGEKAMTGGSESRGLQARASEASSPPLESVLLSCLNHPPFSVLPDLPVSVASVIGVLKQLYWINENISDARLRSNGMPPVEWSPRELSDDHFFSHKLSAKLLRQLSDPVALCGRVIPSWCFSLARDAPFLLPFEARRILFQSTSLGVARALHLLQTRVDVSGVIAPSSRGSSGQREQETRIGRIQRQKVRVHRNRILESAIKVMSIYGADSTILEVEYFDEAGTGLGPTLEFYTLTSREIQRADLGLWRGSYDNRLQRKSQRGGNTSAAVSGKAKGTSGCSAAIVRRRSRRHSQNSNPSVLTSSAGQDEYQAYVVPTGNGLYPACLPIITQTCQEEALAKSTPLFAFVGRLLGKAITDGRLLDLRFSPTLYRLMLAYCGFFFKKFTLSESASDRRSCVNKTSLPDLDSADRELVWQLFTSESSAMSLLKDIDPQLASSLTSIVEMLRTGHSEEVANLCLTFVLPGDDHIELVMNGKDTEVTGKNAIEYVQRVVYHILFGGVFRQVEALLQGLGEVLDVTSLLVFKFNELELLLCGPSFEKWTIDFLVQATQCDHGYTHESSAVQSFFRILSDLDQVEQQRFVLFATGSPALPLGGLRNLHPRLTIVRRTPEAGRSSDECLPTVMTCTNYFKLPDYSSPEIARRQVMYAIREGQGSFHLS